MEFIVIVKYILLILGIALSLFYAFTCLFGWAHYNRWHLLITKTEAKLTGNWLQKYLNTHALLAFLYAFVFLLFCFKRFASIHGYAFFLLSILTVRTELHFKSIAEQNKAKD